MGNFRDSFRFFTIMSTSLFVIISGISVSAMANDKDIQFIRFKNCGAYTLDSVMLHWIDADTGEKSKKKLMGTVPGYYGGEVVEPKNNGICLNLDDQDITEGSEVWISFDIEAGELKDCQGSTKRIYTSGMGSKNNTQNYRSEGETLTNNHCRIGKISDHTADNCDGSIKKEFCN